MEQDDVGLGDLSSDGKIFIPGSLDLTIYFLSDVYIWLFI